MLLVQLPPGQSDKIAMWLSLHACRWVDMVGHSQLESDMLEATPASPADCETVSKASYAAGDELSVTEDEADDKGEVGSGSDEEGRQADEGSSAHEPEPQPLPLPVPQPGRKRKRSGPQHRQALVAAYLCMNNNMQVQQHFGYLAV